MGVALLPWDRLSWTPAALVAALFGAAALIHVRGAVAQLLSRALWLWAAWLCLLPVFGAHAGPSWSWLGIGGALATLALRGRDGLEATSTGAFQPGRFRAPLVLALMLSLTAMAGFATFASAMREGWGSWTGNLNIAGSIGVAAFGLVRMRTWGLLLLGAIDAWIAVTAARGGLAIWGPSATVLGITAAGALIGLSPWLHAAAKQLLRDAEPGDRVRVATPSEHTDTNVARLGVETGIEAGIEADAELLASVAARPATSRSSL